MEELINFIENLKTKIQKEKISELKEFGYLRKVQDLVVFIEGVSDAFLGEVLNVVQDGKVKGRILTLALYPDYVGGIIIDGKEIKEGDLVERTGEIISIPVGKNFLGRVINPLGEPIDGLGEIKEETRYPLERPAPSVLSREPVKEPLHTGIKIIDSMIPIGRGQRELILGDRHTGKTTLVLDTILHQRFEEKPLYCIYVAIGQKMSKVKRLVKILKDYGAMSYTTVIVASSSDSASLQYLAPFAGCSLGEYFRDNGMDSLVIYDDLTKHAWAWREISLLLKKPAGREAYPGDIFYLHSRLLERAAKLKDGGSLTAIPIIETQLGDITSYIPTNVISITDGQIYLETELFFQGFRPAVSIGLSVSRVGSSAQTKAIKKVAGMLRLDLARFRELQAFLQFASDLDEATQKKLRHGQVLMKILEQKNQETITFDQLTCLLWAAINGYFDKFDLKEIKDLEKEFLDELQKEEFVKEIRLKKDITPEIEQKLKEFVIKFIDSYERSKVYKK